MHIKRTWTVVAALLAALALVATACGDDSENTSTGDDTEATVSVEEPWSRATAPGATTGAVYMTLTADSDDALVGASVDASIAGDVQIHEVVTAGDMDTDMDDMDTDMDADMDADMDTEEMDHEGGDGMTMQEVDEIPLPAGEAVVLEPGGYHIMLLELVGQLQAGDTFDVTLQFESGGTETVTAEVREV